MSIINNFTSLSDFYKKIGLDKFEGHSGMCSGETEFLREIVKDPNIKTLLEIGFNAGHSSESFLSSNETLKVWSFDLGQYTYVLTGKSYIDHKYPKRHTLTIGDSKSTIPTFSDNFEDMKFDCIFIDGDHSYEGAMADLMNCKRLAHKDTILIMDDIVKTKGWIQEWNKGTNQAWSEVIDNGLITEQYQQDFKKGFGVAYGKYNFL